MPSTKTVVIPRHVDGAQSWNSQVHLCLFDLYATHRYRCEIQGQEHLMNLANFRLEFRAIIKLRTMFGEVAGVGANTGALQW